jgi:hypothetical protein
MERAAGNKPVVVFGQIPCVGSTPTVPTAYAKPAIGSLRASKDREVVMKCLNDS